MCILNETSPDHLIGTSGSRRNEGAKNRKIHPRRTSLCLAYRKFIQLGTFSFFLTENFNPLLHEPNKQGVSIEWLLSVSVSIKESLP